MKESKRSQKCVAKQKRHNVKNGSCHHMLPETHFRWTLANCKDCERNEKHFNVLRKCLMCMFVSTCVLSIHVSFMQAWGGVALQSVSFLLHTWALDHCSSSTFSLVGGKISFLQLHFSSNTLWSNFSLSRSFFSRFYPPLFTFKLCSRF